MKKEKGFSLIVLVVTIIVIIIMAAITFTTASNVLKDSADAKIQAQAKIDDDKIESVIQYETAGTYDLIDEEIDLKRLPLSNDLEIVYNGKTYGEGYALYISAEDLVKVEAKTGRQYFYKQFKDITKSYVVNSSTGDYVRLQDEWVF